MKKKILIGAGAVLFVLLFLFFAMPNLNPLYAEGAFLWCVVISVVVAVLTLRGSFKLKTTTTPGGRTVIDFGGAKHPPFKRLVWVLLPWAVFVVVNVISMPLFNSDAYKNQLTEPEEKVFSSDMQAIDVDSIPVVDKALAAKLADKKLGEKPSLGSQVVLGEPVIQTVNEELVWVVPLYHSGLFKWVSNMDGSDGYIVVSATNMRDVEYVEGYKIKYQPNAYLFDNLQRKIRFSGGFFTGIDDFSFELDDTGRPYWVVTTYRNSWGFSLPEADGIILLDAQTGETHRYGLDEIPEWVDRVQPEDFIINQINNMGEYVHGVFNFSNKDKFSTSEGHSIVYNGGRCYLFTGLTSVGSDDSAIGFMMVDMVTKQPYRYQIAGATETAAMSSAMGQVQNLKYTASFPLIINVGGEPTYFMTLKDNEGLVKQYAFVSVEDYLIVGTGETITDALQSYETNLQSGGDTDLNFDNNQTAVLEGTVLRFASEQKDGNTVYRMLIDTMPDVIFECPQNVSKALALTREGDSVSLTYYEGDTPLLTVSEFKNNTLGQ